LEGDVTITTYANILDESQFVWKGMPKNELYDMQKFKQYTRFKPEIKMKYVRYFAKGNNEKELNKYYPLLNDRERMGRIANNYGVDSAKYLDLAQVSELEDLSGENYRFVRSIERENGQKTFLRIYNDMYVDPFESEISAALKRLVMKLPQVAFIEGHGERDAVKMNDYNYGVFAQEKTFRSSLINQGFDFRQVSLDQPIPEDITIIVLADMRTKMTPEQEKNLDDYIARGGNMLIAGEARRQAFMNPILEKFGVSLLPGRLVCPSANWEQDLVAARLTDTAVRFSFHFATMLIYNQRATMPSAAGLDISNAREKGFEPVVLMVADTAKRPQMWSEVETTNFVDDTAKLNPAVGEKLLQDVPMMVALYRKMGDKEQRIMVLGDADCLSTGQLSRNYRGIRSGNFSLITSSFFWMSDGEAPIDIRRPAYIDNKLFVTPTGFLITKIFFMGILPIGLLIFAILLWVRRKGR
jgi:ABC-2 type transport system permease protein